MKKRGKITKRRIAIIEIFLMVIAIFAFAYVVRDNSDSLTSSNEKDSSNYSTIISNILSLIGKIVFGEKGLVSAASVYTCLKDKAGDICMEYSSDFCDAICEENCIQTSKRNTVECIEGTCYDDDSGTCTLKSTKNACEEGNGTWFSDPNGNVEQCRQGCCVYGSQTSFTTEQECRKTSSLLGFVLDFRRNIDNQLSCLALASTQEEGACIFHSDDENACTFETKVECLQKNGDFHSGTLCSNTGLNTTCTKQKTTGCVDDKVYWFDSCGNRENIYDADKIKSFNEGFVLNVNQSCTLNIKSNKLSCGNCNRLLGSTCGLNEDEANPKYVCQDLNCVDENGNVRQNGESWCAYQSSIGVDVGSGGLKRSIDVPGSTHARKICSDGEIRTDVCGTYRGAICIENQIDVDGKKRSNSACKSNMAATCLEINTKSSLTSDGKRDACNEKEDCFVKEVNIGESFSFNICAPKYPAGFDLTDSESSSSICSIASQYCTVLYVKDMGGSWECEQNCQCETSEFAEQMNDLCISLGDCGTKVNIAGDLTYNSNVLKDGDDLGNAFFGKDYLNRLIKYSSYKNSPNKFVDAKEGTFYGELALSGENDVSTEDYDLGTTYSLVSGAGGVALMLGTSAITTTTTTTIAGKITTLSTWGGSTTTASVVGGIGGALAGAAIGLAVVSLLIQFTGIGGAIGEEGTYALMGAGAAAGAAIGAVMGVTGAGLGTTLSAGLTTLTSGLAAGASTGVGTGTAVIGAAAALTAAIAIVVVVLVVLFILVEWLLGAGDSKEVYYSFSCNPWEAPRNSNKCSRCGKDGFPCTKYQCESLGQNCEIVNENDFDNVACVSMASNDASPPAISPLQSSLPEGYSYETIENGAKVKGPEDCIPSFNNISIGISLSENAKCRYELTHTDSYDKMNRQFGRNLFLVNQSINIIMPSLDSLAVSGYDPTRTADFNVYVRCNDKTGNANVDEYIINFCVKPENDKSPPVVTGRTPINEFVAYGTERLNASIFTNEPSECKWDEEDKAYSEMTNNLTCFNRLQQQELLGWKCKTEFVAKKNDTTYYIRCRDQPWLIESPDGIEPARIVTDSWENTDGTFSISTINVSANKTRNSMTAPYLFNIKTTKTKLNIDSIKPNNETMTSGKEPISVTLEVKTSGGISNSVKCLYKLSNMNSFSEFANTFSTTHKQIFDQFNSGEKVIQVKCSDSIGNEVNKTARFKLDTDNIPPIITKVYNSNNNLYVITDENSSCKINKDDSLGCGFDWNNATLMSGEQQTHIALFNEIGIVYVKCKDKYSNSLDGCGAVVKGAGYL